jgi:heptosyltransferase-2
LKFALIPWLAGIDRRVGYKGESRYGLINVMHHDDPQAPRAMVPFYAALATEPATLPPQNLPRPRLCVDAAQIKTVLNKSNLRLDAPLIAFAPGAEFGNAKRWPVKHFAQLADSILAEHPQAQIVLLGSGKDIEVCEQVHALAPALHNLAGKTSLDEAIALIAYASAMVSNDSGLLHVASALNRPVIAIYGPTDPDHAPPFSDMAASLSLRLPCAPCKQRECPLGHHDCMNKLDSNMVWQPLRAMLDCKQLTSG